MTTDSNAVSDIVSEILVLCNETKIDEKVHRGPEATHKPSLIVVILILKNLFGFNSERSFLRYLSKHHGNIFPNLPEQSWFNRKARKLCAEEKDVYFLLLKKLGVDSISIRIVDSTPVPVVRLWRAGNCTLFKRKKEVNFGFCASKDMYYYGEKLTLFTTPEGIPTGFLLTPANMHDVRALKENLKAVADDIKGKTLITDKGYYDGELETTLKVSYRATQVVPEKRRHRKKNTQDEKKFLKKRGIIETVNDQLQEQMDIDETLARSHEGLFSRIQAAILAFTFGAYHNFINDLPLLALKGIMT